MPEKAYLDALSTEMKACYFLARWRKSDQNKVKDFDSWYEHIGRLMIPSAHVHELEGKPYMRRKVDSLVKFATWVKEVGS
jgi:hypothetical protein